MYLFQLIKLQFCLSGLIIYIPLCIYFNNICKIFDNGITFIYIPLCIYFNFSVPFREYLLAKIYIPLCIYFNHSPTFILRIRFLFTFHYVSISTQCLRFRNLKERNIYIPLCIYFNTYHY